MLDKYYQEFLTSKLAQSKIDFVLQQLIDINKNITVDEEHIKYLILTSSNFTSNEDKYLYSLITHDVYNVGKNKLITSLRGLINDFYDDKILEQVMNSDFKLKFFDELDEKQKLTFVEIEIASLFAQLKQLSVTYSDKNPAYEWVYAFESQLNNFEVKWNERRFQIAIVALVKAGKSTLLNAWIGNEYLPSATTPETMQIIKIRHNPKKAVGVLHIDGKEQEKGSEKIRKFLRTANDKSRTSVKLDSESDVILEVNLELLKNKSFSGYGFDILDTPGTNEFGVATLPTKVEFICKTSDVIIYLIDFTRLNTNNEAEMFSNLKQWRQELFQQIESRLFFVVNKIDVNNRHDREKKLTPDEIKRYVSNIIFTYSDIKVEEKNILLVSSEFALLSRLVGGNIATNEQLQDFKLKAFGEIGVDDVTDEECLKGVPKLLNKSGFKELEEKMFDSIYSNRSFIFFKSITDEIEKSLEQVINNLEVGKGTLKSDKKTIDKLRKDINEIKKQIKNLSDDKVNFKKKADEIIHKRFKEFYDAVQKLISDRFSTLNGAKIMVNSNLVFGHTDYSIKDSNKDNLMRKMNDVDKFIRSSIENQFQAAWSNIIEDIYAQYLILEDILQSKSKPIIKQVEKTINETFEVKLNPSKDRILTPSFANYYNDMQYNFISSIKMRFNYKEGNWLSRLFHYISFVFASIMDNNVQIYEVTTVDYRKKISIKNDEVIAVASTIANKVIEERYLKTVKEAEESLKKFIDRYVAIIEEEIKNTQPNVIDIPKRIENIEFDISETKKVLNKLFLANAAITRLNN